MSDADERQQLSSFIKQVHRCLRIQSKKLGVAEAWTSHCSDDRILLKYAQSMQTLATVYWDSTSSNEESLAKSRIEWVVRQCQEYFYNSGLDKQRFREQKILDLLQDNSINPNLFLCLDKIKLLDVGSCYNPFNKYDIFDVIALDIAPANNNVFKCDFVNVNIVSKLSQTHSICESITELQEKSFNVIVFSLLLDYLPSSELRLKSCEKAYRLLQTEGILIIISPDSKHVGANAKFMKCWRYALSTMGFLRIKYEKLAHIHCMVFRKSLSPEVPRRWAKLHENENFKIEMNIPQDFNNDASHDIESEETNQLSLQEDNAEDVLYMFQELPDL